MNDTSLEGYSTILESYLVNEDERSLQQAYEFGRNALEKGIGLLKVAEVHNRALSDYLDSSRKGGFQSVSMAAEVLNAGLAPFEMTHRGYEETVRSLRILNEELDSFNHAVSHDLRAPIRAVMGFTRIFLEQEKANLTPSGLHTLEKILATTSSMGTLIDALLGLSRLNKSEVVKVDINLSQLATEVIEQLWSLEPERKANISVAPNLRVKGDLHLLRIAFTNLLSNAWKFTSKKGTSEIEIGTVKKGSQTVYFVRDNGVGFDLRYTKNLFAPFQRFHSSHDFEGIGVGLATVQRIIQKHEGQIWAEAEVNRGATFFFTL